MEVRDALSTGELSKGTVIAGHEGVTREVLSIEVMEVPDVVTWVTPGILLMTAFYSIKDKPEKQTDIVNALINVGAAGIVIKVGRFIESLPEEMIKLANENKFPIIVIPKEVSYINILRPLFEKLFDEKQLEVEKNNNPFYEIQKTNFSELSHAIEAISEVVGTSVYIEDMEGRLLYVTKNFRPDGWRTQAALFSEPDGDVARKIIEEQNIYTSPHLDIDIQGFRNHLILPLTTSNTTFALIHIPYKDKLNLSKNAMRNLSSQISELFMNDQLYLQRKRFTDAELMKENLHQFISDQSSQRAIIYFFAQWIEKIGGTFSPLIDYSSMVSRYLQAMSQQLDNCELIIFKRYNRFYGLIHYYNQSYSDMVRQWHDITSEYNKEVGVDQITISISPPLKDETSLDNVVRSTTKIMQIGAKTKPSNHVYTYDQLGIYDILQNLTNDESVINYVENVLEPLKTEDGELERTLKVYLDENGNVSKSSERLYIHRRTLTYRLRKIERLLNTDLNDASSRFILTFCFMIKDLY